MHSLRENKHAVIKIVGLIIVIILSGGGGYIYGINWPPIHATEQKAAASLKTATPSPKPKPTFHTVVSEGHPFGTNLKIITNLGVPNNLQALVRLSVIQDPGYTGILTNKFNAEMGRWIFGRPNFFDSSTAGQLSFIHLESSWINTKTPNPYGDDASRQDQITGLTLGATTTQKKAFIAKWASDSSKCVSDPTTGFVIDNKINVCFQAIHMPQSAETYDPYLQIKGYGKIENQNFVILGSLFLNDGTIYSGAQQDEFTKEFRDGSIPPQTKTSIENYVNALKQSTITVEHS